MLENVEGNKWTIRGYQGVYENVNIKFPDYPLDIAVIAPRAELIGNPNSSEPVVTHTGFAQFQVENIYAIGKNAGGFLMNIKKC